ncbi:hypothetical protein SSS_04618 [Sarcoptes scabiei]|uniref:Uncharacterized protein n=1 Tax=Sarcoptes scabiei TaxID=52283 RepID=A0A834R672_SARSC|nr:hypothetical protein SSS_04618 [Sarcoptes scabiei]
MQRLADLGMFQSAIPDDDDDDDDDDDEGDGEKNGDDRESREDSRSYSTKRLRRRRKRKRSQRSQMDDLDDSRGSIIRSLRWVILIFLFIMIFMSLHIFTEDIKHLEDVKRSENRAIPLTFVMCSLIMIAIGFYSVYYVQIQYISMFMIGLTVLIILKMNTEFWQKNSLNSILFHISHFVVLFCGWTFVCLGSCRIC